MKNLLRVAPPLAAVAVFGFLCSSVASAADKAASDQTGADKDHAGATAGHALMGRIENVDASKRIIMLTNVKPWHGDKAAGADRGASSTDRGTAADREGAADRDRTAASDNNKSTGAAGDNSRTTGSAGAHNKATMVQVAENAKITLDGKQAELGDLKENMYVRVYLRGARSEGADRGASSGAATTDRDRTGASDTNKSSGASGDNNRTTGATGGAHLIAERIDAHTHAPTDAGGQSGTREK